MRKLTILGGVAAATVLTFTWMTGAPAGSATGRVRLTGN